MHTSNSLLDYSTVHMQCLTRELKFETLLMHSSAHTHLCTHDHSASFVRALAFPLEHLCCFTLEHLLANFGIIPLHHKTIGK